jgi:hypothetical protein
MAAQLSVGEMRSSLLGIREVVHNPAMRLGV